MRRTEAPSSRDGGTSVGRLVDALIGEPLSWVFGPAPVERKHRRMRAGELTALALEGAVSWLGLVRSPRDRRVR